MSKKNISRSALEGGRANYSRNERKQANNKDRQYRREYCHKARYDEDYSESTALKERPGVGRAFTDKLNPGMRWLRSNCGKPWAEVKSELHSRFDSRTISGRHILYDHLLKSVRDIGVMDDHRHWSWYDFYVDDGGILRLSEKNQWNRRSWRGKKDKKEYTSVTWAWSNDRKVIDYGDVQYWTAPPDEYRWGTCHHSSCHNKREYRSGWIDCKKTIEQLAAMPKWEKKNYTVVENDKVMRWEAKWWCYHPATLSYRQDVKFTKEEADIWKNLHPKQKEALIYIK